MCADLNINAIWTIWWGGKAGIRLYDKNESEAQFGECIAHDTDLFALYKWQL